jgi:hypothetical protein
MCGRAATARLGGAQAAGSPLRTQPKGMSVNRLKGMDQHMEEPGRPMVMPVREVEPHR